MMKKLVSIMAFVALTAASATVSFAGQTPGTGVNESMHDITYLGATLGFYNQDDFQRVCVFCHTPHNALPNGSVPAPLWNHAQSNVNLAPYTWAAPANLPIAFNADPLVGPSRLCMACHDGVTAVDSHGSAGSSNNGNHVMTSHYTDGLGNDAKRFINDLGVTHPIGFLYQDAINARNTGGATEIVTPDQHFLTTVPANPDTHLRTGFVQGSKAINDTLYSGYMTCASCHEVHNTNNVASTAGIHSGITPNYFLWAPEQKSTICLSCHIK
jgi:hypothetical protein